MYSLKKKVSSGPAGFRGGRTEDLLILYYTNGWSFLFTFLKPSGAID